jgi:acyl carrier protein
VAAFPRGSAARDEVLAILAGYGDRAPDQVPEDIDSMELAWLLHQLDQRYGRSLDSDDALLARMATVSGVVEVLAELGGEPGHG